MPFRQKPGRWGRLPAWLNRAHCSWLSGSQAGCHSKRRAVVCQWNAWVSVPGLVLFSTVAQDLGAEGECTSNEFAEDAEVGDAVGSRDERPCRGSEIGGMLGNHQWQEI